MSLLEDWRHTLASTSPLFATLLKEDLTISVPYGITASAILWYVRDKLSTPMMIQVLTDICGEIALPLLREALMNWGEFEPHEAARTLTRLSHDNEALRSMLDKLLAYFRDDLLALHLLQVAPSNITIEGSVSGGNIVIGGVQYVAGDLIIQYLKPKTARMCPKPPPEPEKFGGRDVRLREIMEKIKAGTDTAITAVHGLSGIGKTTLARALAAHLYSDKTFRAVLWADVTRTPSAVNILSAWVVSYADSTFDLAVFKGDEGQIAAAVKAQLDSVIAEQCEDCDPPRVLMVLDDVWDNGRDAARLIKRACPAHTTILITTRSENVAIDLGAQAESLAYMTPDESVGMLKMYLFNIPDDTLRRLGKALGGHALALELAARRIQKEKRPGESEAERLERCIHDYETGIPAGSPFDRLKLEQGEQKEDNLTHSLAYSYGELDEDGQQRFRALGVLAFDVAFDAALLAALWELPVDEVYDHTNRLALLSLLEITQDGYYQHPLLRAYARALLIAAGETNTAFNRYADFVIAQAARFDELPLEQWTALDLLLPHIQEVGDTLVRQWEAATPLDDPLKVRARDFAYNIISYVHNRPQMIETPQGQQRLGMRWLEMGLVAARETGNSDRQTLFLNSIGVVWAQLGEPRRALDLFQQALPLFQAVGNRHGEATTLTNIGSAWAALGEVHQALDFYRQALPLRQAVGDQRSEATTLTNIGAAWAALGDQHQALDFFQQALPLSQAVGDRHGEATTLNNIGGAWADLSEPRRALDFFQQALPLSQAVGDRHGEATTLNSIGSAWADLGEPRRALGFFQQALPLSQAVGDRHGEATTLNNIGSTWATLGDQRQALDFFQQVLPLFQAVGNRRGEAATLNSIGVAWAELGKPRWALGFFQQALPLFQAVGDQRGEAVTLNSIGGAWAELGDQHQALEFYQQALPLRRAVDDRRGAATTLNNIANAWAELGKPQRALKFYQQALRLFQAVGDQRGEGYICNDMAVTYEELGDLKKAIAFAKRGADLLQKIDDVNAATASAYLERLKGQRKGGSKPS